MKQEVDFLDSPGMPSPLPPSPYQLASCPSAPPAPPRELLMWDFPPPKKNPKKLEVPSLWEQPPPSAPPIQHPAPTTPSQVIMPVSPEIDPAALSRQLRGHEVKHRKAGAEGFRTGKKWIPRRSARNYQLVSFGETMDYEES
ncbi:hypothetical protein HHI36_019191 [Cryptolaemus montrouzieri]|uniref:Uncharacterized protein n=1 Tax=Cryptolaemus montrouzieri TaxID=559131 RepID=A0ABD2P295_9CUCU